MTAQFLMPLFRRINQLLLYGRDFYVTDPRWRSIPGVNIPNCPSGKSPEAAPATFYNAWFWLDGWMWIATARQVVIREAANCKMVSRQYIQVSNLVDSFIELSALGS
ncbi:hypothetical protein Dimus_025586 [Dionaea muscipula]